MPVHILVTANNAAAEIAAMPTTLAFMAGNEPYLITAIRRSETPSCLHTQITSTYHLADTPITFV